MYVTDIPNRNSPPTILVRESYREGDQNKNRTLANITRWPPEAIEALRLALKGVRLVPADKHFEIVRTLPHGHVAAVLGTVKRLKLDEAISSRRTPDRDRVVALIVSRLLDPKSKLATARGLMAETTASTLGSLLDLESVTAEEFYESMDWLLARQGRIEKTLARRHLSEGSLVLYDVTSVYFEGRKCPLARYGHSRDGKKDKLQIVVGLLCNEAGCPVAVEVFEGNTADPKTLASQIVKIRKRFRLRQVILVGDRGLLTQARIEEELAPEGLDWITALRAPAIQELAHQKYIQPSLFDERDLAEITSPDFPGERLIACRNPFLQDERARKREELLQATEEDLNKIVAATQREKRPLRGAAWIGMRVGKGLERHKVGKHFRVEITEETFRYERDVESIEREAALDGIYVIRTSVPVETLDAEGTVKAYKRLSGVERAFRSLKTVDLKVRPVYHRLADRVRAHVLVCMLACYVEWHMREALAPLLFDDDDRVSAAARRESIVAPAQRSLKAERKAEEKRTETGEPVESFQTMLANLATLTRNRVRFIEFQTETNMLTQPTPQQQRIFDLLQIPIPL
jgi:transposase